MPFTPSHIAAALPFVRTPLPIAPLVIGTMAPDVPYYLPLRVPPDLTPRALRARIPNVGPAGWRRPDRSWPFDPSPVFLAVTGAGGAAGPVGVIVCAIWWIRRT